MAMGLYQRYRFHLGQGISCIVRATEVTFGVYDKYKIDSIIGSGNMYADVSNFTCEHYDETAQQWITDNSNWGNFLGTTLNINQEPVVNQGTIDISGATSIAANFLNGFYFEGIILGNPTSIGEYAFAGGWGQVNTGSVDHNTCNRMTAVVIPASVTHMGQGAFAYCNVLSAIQFENENYQIEEYPNGTEIFYVFNGSGANLDEDGYFITTLYGSEEQGDFDWRHKCNRAIDALTGVVKVYSARANKILTFKAQMRPANPDAFAIRVMGAGYLQLVPVSSADASPVRVYTGSRIMALKKTN